jgi:hypothetical protein
MGAVCFENVASRGMVFPYKLIAEWIIMPGSHLEKIWLQKYVPADILTNANYDYRPSLR